MAGEFPREYRASSRPGAMTFAVAGTCVLVAFIASKAEQSHGNGLLIAALVGVPFLLVGLATYFTMRRARVILTADSIEVRHAIRIYYLRRDEIIALRRHRRRDDVTVLELYSRVAPNRAVALPTVVELDSDFDAWIAGIPNLDKQDQNESG